MCCVRPRMAGHVPAPSIAVKDSARAFPSCLTLPIFITHHALPRLSRELICSNELLACGYEVADSAALNATLCFTQHTHVIASSQPCRFRAPHASYYLGIDAVQNIGETSLSACTTKGQVPQGAQGASADPQWWLAQGHHDP